MPRTKTIKEFREEVKELGNNEYILLSNEYINNKTKVKMKHNKCGYEYEVRPDMFLRGERCPKCANIIRNIDKRISHEEFIKRLNEKNLLEDYEIISKYINNRTKIKIKHIKCNNIFEMTPNNFLNDQQGCIYCFKTPKKTVEGFKKEVNDLTNGEYSLLSDKYINNKTKVKMKHNKCGYEYMVTPYHFIQGRRCPKCRESKGEKRIERWLIKNNIQYKKQYKIDDCKYKNPLPFDFKLDYEDGGILLIEYDGIQHEKGYYIYNEEGFNLQKIRDDIKDNYCKNHKIDLLRISYKDFDNIEKILEESIC